MKIHIIGYYDHCNIGDEQYKLTFEYFINKMKPKTTYTLNFIDSDKLKLFNRNNFDLSSDIVIIGGGDILNDYFLDQILSIFDITKFYKKFFAISVGIPYIDIINTNKLSIFHTIYLRTKQDLNNLQINFNNINFEYCPDISYYLKEINSNDYTFYKLPKSIIKKYI